jgi:SAM-dependent methyltransferase
MKTGDHVVRYSMYKALEAEPRCRILKGPVLSISHSTLLCKRLSTPGLEIIEANYPQHKINELRFPDNTFEAVVSDQVLEHIECSPVDAVREVHRVLRPGGLAIHTTCFLTPYHGSGRLDDTINGDFWRFTPSGLARLHKDYGELIVAEGWGNALMPLLGGLGLIHMPVPEAHWHPLNKLARMNRNSYAYVVWVVARK